MATVGRGDWGAREARDRSYPGHPGGRITQIVVHHSYSPDVSDWLRAGSHRTVQGIQDFHMDRREWNDIGYHYVVTPDGAVYQGTPEGMEGTHVKGLNAGRLGVCLVGNFERPSELGRARRGVARLEELLKDLAHRYGLGPEAIVGHRDLAHGRRCPGRHLERAMVGIRARMARASGAPP